MLFTSRSLNLYFKSATLMVVVAIGGAQLGFAAKSGKREKPLPKPVTIVVTTPEEIAELQEAAQSVQDSAQSASDKKDTPEAEANSSPSDPPVAEPQPNEQSEAEKPKDGAAPANETSSEGESAQPDDSDSDAKQESQAPAATVSEHDVHRPLQLPPLNPPSVDVKSDPVYQEMLKAIMGSKQLTLVGDIVPVAPPVSTALPSAQPSDAIFHAAEKLLKVARKLEKEEVELVEEGNEAGAARTRKHIRDIRQVVLSMLDVEDEDEGDDADDQSESPGTEEEEMPSSEESGE